MHKVCARVKRCFFFMKSGKVVVVFVGDTKTRLGKLASFTETINKKKKKKHVNFRFRTLGNRLCVVHHAKETVEIPDTLR